MSAARRKGGCTGLPGTPPGSNGNAPATSREDAGMFADTYARAIALSRERPVAR